MSSRRARALGYRFPFWGSPSLRLAGVQPGRDGHRISLPLLGKPFIEAVRPRLGRPPSRHRFPFWGSPSLRLSVAGGRRVASPLSLPLLGKPFIEAHRRLRGSLQLRAKSLPLLGKPFIEATSPLWTTPAGSSRSLPLLGKPFIEAQIRARRLSSPAGSLPLLGKPFIEANNGAALNLLKYIASPSGEALH